MDMVSDQRGSRDYTIGGGGSDDLDVDDLEPVAVLELQRFDTGQTYASQPSPVPDPALTVTSPLARLAVVPAPTAAAPALAGISSDRVLLPTAVCVCVRSRRKLLLPRKTSRTSRGMDHPPAANVIASTWATTCPSPVPSTCGQRCSSSRHRPRQHCERTVTFVYNFWMYMLRMTASPDRSPPLLSCGIRPGEVCNY